MLITHTFIDCIHCGKKLEVFDEDRNGGQVDCFVCGYSNELTDIRIDFYYEEY